MSNRIFNSMKNYENTFLHVPDNKQLSTPIPAMKKNNNIFVKEEVEALIQKIRKPSVKPAKTAQTIDHN